MARGGHNMPVTDQTQNDDDDDGYEDDDFILSPEGNKAKATFDTNPSRPDGTAVDKP